MKLSTLISLGLIPFTVAQSESLGPPPTESFGCEPHGDHYHCEGHVSETAAPSTSMSGPGPTTTSAEEDHDRDHDHDHDHDHETGSLSPSPTASVGCEPHGDHWHCDGPAETGTPTASVTASESLPPSPTASTGCEPHGDHWHCDGPAETGDSESPTSTPGAAAAQAIPIAGALVAAALAF